MSEMYGNVNEVLSCDYDLCSWMSHGLLSYFQISYPNTTIKFKYVFLYVSVYSKQFKWQVGSPQMSSIE